MFFLTGSFNVNFQKNCTYAILLITRNSYLNTEESVCRISACWCTEIQKRHKDHHLLPKPVRDNHMID